MIRTTLFSLAVCAFFISSCTSATNDERRNKTRDLNFDQLKGIKFYEVKRRFSNDLSFNEDGFMQKPSWIIQFVSSDSLLAYSPQKNIMQGFHFHYDHGRIYNFAKEWFRFKQISKDSLNIQRLHLKGKNISNDIRSDVNVTFYSEDYINNVLKTTAEELQKPTRADTLFIQSLTDKSNQDPANAELAFAATTTVQFKPLSDMIRVKQISHVDKLAEKTESYDYLYPYFRVDIDRAYDDFGYDFTAVVDATGKMHLKTIGRTLPENVEARTKTTQAIIDVYFQNLFKIVPGTTLGIPHSTLINITVVGRKTKK